MCCLKCNSAKHFACNCTGPRNNIITVVESDQVHLTLFNVDTHYQNVIHDSNIKMSNLVKKILGMAVLDSACSWTIARKLWFDIFFETLNDRDKCFVKTAKSNRTFCFGDGVKVKTINLVKFPVTIWGVKGIRVYTETNSKKMIYLYY